MMDATEPVIALELERLRGTVGTGLAEIKGQLDVIRTQGDRAAEDITKQALRTERLETRVRSVELKVMAAAGASSILGAVAGVATAYLTR